ncbi:response regulator [Magnetospirillum sp. UT-4]|uniref:hybrid sensor histidine kinase/response regulator n=1 Tax=Magnetospirillum sp. UT-4 TaxID=2681467 RepID=UPI001383C3FA|nr:response regulator [Magnetospirillum sp. UT-4]CAA7627115.1 putative two-component sensor histidine kinase, unorthodox system [Magnetospirillum sp. UT-4]
MHRLLLRQLRRALGVESEDEVERVLAGLQGGDPAALPTVVAALPDLLKRVGDTYEQHERDLTLRQRSLELSSDELGRANAKLRAEAEAQARAIDSLRRTASEILTSMGQQAIGGEDVGLEALSGLMAALVRDRGTFQRELEQQKFALDQHAIVSITDQAGNIVYANDKFCEISEYRADELIGHNHRIVNSGLHPKEFFEDMWNTISSGRVWHGEICNRKKGGGLYWVAATIVPIRDDQGRCRQYIGIRTDITDRRRIEDLLKEAVSKAEAASRAKSDFLATMSHEIRTPMNGIIGMTSLLLDTELSRDQRHFATTVRTSAEALLSIINDILDFSKMEAGKLEFEETAFEIRPLVEGVVDILGPRLKGRSIDLSYLIPQEARGVFRGDPGRLRQVLLNLAGNAVKFTEKGAVSIIVSLKAVDGDRATLRVKVTDTGVGIPDAARERLFSMFSQADASTARRFGGSGLGLAISKRIVDMLGGTIGFESREGLGSTFWFEVPLIRSSEAPTDDLPENPLLGTRILVVDDNVTNREIFQHQLESWGATVELADSAAAGLMAVRGAAMRGLPFEVVLLDHLMPGMSGLDLAAVLRADPNLAALRLLLATSEDLSQVRELTTALRIDQILVKPIRQSALLDHLMLLLGRGIERTVHTRPEDDEMKGPLLSLKVLVAEDNAINQQVAVGLLAKLGHRADVADDGGEAVSLVEQGDYDLVLMDMQMPHMDGLAATRMIRALPGDKAKVVIIAMTANAMTGDREICLEAGMDDYIAKPIDRHRLRSVLDRWAESLLAGRQDRDVAPSTIAEETGPAAAAPCIDHDAVADGGEADGPLVDAEAQADLADTLGEESFAALVASFQTSLPNRLRDIRVALDAGNAAAVAAAAHSLKGAAANLGYLRLARATGAMEAAAKAGEADLEKYYPAVVSATRLSFPEIACP